MFAGQRQLVGHGGDHARAGGAEWVAERDGAAVHVEAGGVDGAGGFVAAEAGFGKGIGCHHLEHGEHLRGEGFVQVDKVGVGERDAGAVERAGDGEGGSHQQLVGGVDADVAPRAQGGERGVAERFGFFFAHDQHGRGTVGERARIAGGEGAILGKDRAQLGELVDAGIGAHQRVGEDIADRCDLAREAAALNGSGGAVVALRGEGILGLAADLIAACHLLGGFAHDFAGGALGDLGDAGEDVGEGRELGDGAEQVGGGRAAAHHDRAEGAHDLLRQLQLGVARRVAATGDGDVVVAALDLGGRRGDGLQAARTGAGEGHGFDAGRQLEVERDLAADVGRGRGQDDTAPADGIDLGAVEVEAVDERLGRRDAEVDGVMAQELFECLDERGANATDDDCTTCHGGISSVGVKQGVKQ